MKDSAEIGAPIQNRVFILTYKSLVFMFMLDHSLLAYVNFKNRKHPLINPPPPKKRKIHVYSEVRTPH